MRDAAGQRMTLLKLGTLHTIRVHDAEFMLIIARQHRKAMHSAILI